jgi:hypothetical protein
MLDRRGWLAFLVAAVARPCLANAQDAGATVHGSLVLTLSTRSNHGPWQVAIRDRHFAVDPPTTQSTYDNDTLLCWSAANFQGGEHSINFSRLEFGGDHTVGSYQNYEVFPRPHNMARIHFSLHRADGVELLANPLINGVPDIVFRIERASDTEIAGNFQVNYTEDIPRNGADVGCRCFDGACGMGIAVAGSRSVRIQVRFVLPLVPTRAAG